MLKETFNKLISSFGAQPEIYAELWGEIERNYTAKGRHYHTLNHLENLLAQLLEVKQGINDWDAILFTLFYHDVVYNPLKANNEEKSAQVAEARMRKLIVPDSTIELSKNQILATKAHMKSSNTDTNYFLDADLSVLGCSWELYFQYAKNVRQEYSIYPDFVYNPGRRKVLQHFLAMDKIFKVEFFQSKFEAQAKENLKNELDLLSA